MIHLLLMNDIIVFINLWECESQAWNVYVCMCEMWFIDDIVIDDINLWDDVGVYDNADREWCCYWW